MWIIVLNKHSLLAVGVWLSQPDDKIDNDTLTTIECFAKNAINWFLLPIVRCTISQNKCTIFAGYKAGFFCHRFAVMHCLLVTHRINVDVLVFIVTLVPPRNCHWTLANISWHFFSPLFHSLLFFSLFYSFSLQSLCSSPLSLTSSYLSVSFLIFSPYKKNEKNGWTFK